MDLGLAGRRALVTGDRAGLAAVCAAALEAEGAEIVPTGTAGVTVVVTVADERAPGAVALGGDLDGVVESWGPVVDTVPLYQAALPVMREAGWGRFVHVTGIDARAAEASGTEAARDLAVLALHKVVGGEFGAEGVTANTVLASPDAAPADVAALVAWYAGTRSAYLTGTVVTVGSGAEPAVP